MSTAMPLGGRTGTTTHHSTRRIQLFVHPLVQARIHDFSYARDPQPRCARTAAPRPPAQRADGGKRSLWSVHLALARTRAHTRARRRRRGQSVSAAPRLVAHARPPASQHAHARAAGVRARCVCVGAPLRSRGFGCASRALQPQPQPQPQPWPPAIGHESRYSGALTAVSRDAESPPLAMTK